MNIIEYLGYDNIPERYLDKELIIDRGERVTTEEFLKVAAGIATEIVGRGIFNSPIAVIAEQSFQTLAFYMGILLSGNYYVTLSPELMKNRKSQILKKSGTQLICGVNEPFEKTDNLMFEEIKKSDDLAKDLYDLKKVRDNLPDNPILYEVFTSGSTGNPKGIIKTHEGMIAFLEQYISEFSLKTEDVLANQTPFYFDASAKDIYLNWKLKCTMHILDKKMFIMPIPLVEYLNDNKVNIIQWVPSALCILSKLKVFRTIKPKYLEKIFFVGEVFPIQQLKMWMEALPDTQFINLYGSSEICGVCTYYVVPHDLDECSDIPMGKPFGNVELCIIKNGERVTGADIVGEIWIKSATLSEGYVGLEDRNESAFIENETGRWYVSGDLAKYDENGLIHFVSRKDFQIKHMGHRIELGEIEQIALGIQGVREAACIYVKEKIVLYYAGVKEKAELLKEMKQKTVSYMIPNKVQMLDELPLNANGKIDRQKLKEI